MDQPWMVEAGKLLGLKEIPGVENNPEVVRLFKDAGHPEVKDDETAWCAAFVGACLERAGVTSNKSLSSRSYERYGARLDLPVYGCIGVKKRKGGSAWQGHVGFVVGANRNQIIMLSGNAQNSVNIAAYNREEFTAFVYPRGLEVVKQVLPTTVTGARLNVTEA